MRMFFLNPPFLKNFNRPVRFQAVSPQRALHPPIDLAYGAALCIKEGHEVELLDAPAMDMGRTEVLKRIKCFKADYVVMLTSTASVISDGRFAKQVSKAGPRTVTYGVHATAEPEDTIRRGFDMVARGEYEYTVRDLARGMGPSEVIGLSYSEGQEIRHNLARPLIENLDELPFPARHLLPNKVYYSAIYKNPFTFMLAGRGCPFQCIFCAIPQLVSGRRYRLRSPVKVVEEMLHIERDLKLKSILFNDDTMTASLKNMREICRLIIKRKVRIPWACYSRVDGITQETADLMKRAGCYLVKIGFESGDDRMLQSMKKGPQATTSRALKTAGIYKRAGIQIHGTFVFGMPGETHETIDRTIDFAKRVDADFVQFSVAQPYPGTEFYSYLKSRGYLKASKWSDYLDKSGCIQPIFEYPELSREDMKLALRRAYKSYYVRPHYIAKALRQRVTNWELMKTSLRSGRSVLKYIYSEPR